MADIRIESHVGDVLGRLAHAKQAALIGMGMVGVQLIGDEIMSGFGDPIWDTGNLHGSITKDEPQGDEIHVGTNVNYAMFVHEGTYKMIARPFIRTAIAGGQQAIQEVAAEILQKEMGK